MKKRFEVKRFLFETENSEEILRYMLTDFLIPMNVPNQFIEMKSINKLGTGKVSAHKLCVFFNYLYDKCGKEYHNATNKNVQTFIDFLIYGEKNTLTIHNPQNSISYSSLVGYLSVITDFYKWLDQNYGSEMIFYENSKRVRPQSYLYGQIYTYKYSRIINRTLPNVKPSREYIKWYTKDEISLLLSNFNTFRDKAVFMLTLEGFRIDEVLSMRLSDYKKIDRLIQPSRSKGKQSAINKNTLRTIRISEETSKTLNQYLFEERVVAENMSVELIDEIFINLQGEVIGKPLKYHNFLKILKKCANRAGVDSKKIRTHSGRSTKVMNILEENALNPENSKSDVEIMRYFGWNNINSISSYMNYNSEILANSAFKRIVGDDNDD